MIRAYFSDENSQAVILASECYCTMLQTFFDSGTAKDEGEGEKYIVLTR
jgi:hypothetical protein